MAVQPQPRLLRDVVDLVRVQSVGARDPRDVAAEAVISIAQALASPFSAAFIALEMSALPRRSRSSWTLVT